MTQPEHLTEEQFARYHSRALLPAELLDVDAHLAGCEPCRARLYVQEHAITHLKQLRTDFSEHLVYEQMVACAEGSASPEATRHLKDCAACRAEVDDLAQFRNELKAPSRAPVEIPAPSTRWRLPAAAAVLLAAGITAWVLRQTPLPPPAPTAVVTPAGTPLTSGQKKLVATVLADRKLERAPILDRLITHRGVLLGAPSAAKTFDLIGPMGTTEVSDRPTFRWQPAEGASRYVVALFDENFQRVLESPVLTATEWQPDQPLTRGRIYNWQVNATIGAQTVHAPTPPAGEARFQVVSADVNERIETARRQQPGNHLLLAALCAQAGALDDAARELDQVTDPIAADLRQSLVEIRK